VLVVRPDILVENLFLVPLHQPGGEPDPDLDKNDLGYESQYGDNEENDAVTDEDIIEGEYSGNTVEHGSNKTGFPGTTGESCGKYGIDSRHVGRFQDTRYQ